MTEENEMTVAMTFVNSLNTSIGRAAQERQDVLFLLRTSLPRLMRKLILKSVSYTHLDVYKRQSQLRNCPRLPVKNCNVHGATGAKMQRITEQIYLPVNLSGNQTQIKL